tara:strand:+ start:22582 stop:23898 length:1317 start_codon:yes stop_codon:yes gene_type:complete
MLPQWIIEKKRDGETLSGEEIRFFVDGFSQGKIPDYQTSALAMAICIRGMSLEETVALTQAMLESGDVLNLERLAERKVDKHSTGGIGDKTSLALAPLVASCGLVVPMISGRGLGITGGTLDKLESIPGFRTDLSEKELNAALVQCGCAITGATANLAPADKKLYALRDVTGTVPSVPLITASILSKKLAANLDALVLDVKWGSGAFMKTKEEAMKLADALTRTSDKLGTPASACLSSMDQPLGRAAGNALEVMEIIELLRGDGPDDLLELVLTLGERMLSHGKVAEGEAAFTLLKDKIGSGEALERFRSMVEAQGGDPLVVDDPNQLDSAPVIHPLAAPRNGYLEKVDAEAIGKSCVALGAGRKAVGDAIETTVGISDMLKIGEETREGEPMAIIHALDHSSLETVITEVSDAFYLSSSPVESPPLISSIIGDNKES